jgi:putative DNA methylase
MTSYPKRLIEVDLPIKQISEHARREKSTGEISTLHIWWARRPLAACRAVLCAAIWPDPVDELCPQSFRNATAKILCDFAEKVRTDSDLLSLCHSHWSRWRRTTPTSLNANLPQCWPEMRYALIDFIADFSNRQAATIPAFLETARSLTQAAHESLDGVTGTMPLMVDPFAGGGAIPLEALRIGASTFASDLNPVAVLLNKILLEYIPHYGQQLANEVHKWGMWIKEQANQELAEFYPKDPDGATPIAYLWARTIQCEGPGCGTEVPLLRSLWLAKKENKHIALRKVPNPKGKTVNFELIQDAKARDVGDGTIRRGSATCPVCGYTTSVISVRRQLKSREGGVIDSRLIAIVTVRANQQGRIYRLPTIRDLEIVGKAAEKLNQLEQEYEGPYSFIPDEIFPIMSGVFNAPIYGHRTWGSIFTPRQALTLTTLTRLIQEVSKELILGGDIHLATAVQSILACAVDREAEHSSSLCRWNASGQKMQATFGRQALPMIWDYCETNPFGNSVGSWDSMLECVLAPFDTALSLQMEGQVERATATTLPLPDDAAQILFTDPPYYNAVPYAVM